MRNYNRWMIAIVIIACLQLVACAQATSSAGDDSPGSASRTQHIAGTDLSRVILTSEAAKRLDIQTAPVREMQVHGAQSKVVPYSALLYDLHGETWVFTNPAPLTYIRASITVDHIDGDQVILLKGPPADTLVVTVGAPELYGAELGVGE